MGEVYRARDTTLGREVALLSLWHFLPAPQHRYVAHIATWVNRPLKTED
jgi:hypothetical protein